MHRNQKKVSVQIFLVVVFFCFSACQAYGFGVWEDDLFGNLARRSQRNSHTWAAVAGGFVDGKIETTPPDEILYDRRVDGRLSAGGEVFWGARGAMRLHVLAEAERKRIAGDDPTGAIVDEQRAVVKPSLDFTFVTDKGLELIAGALAYQYKTDVKTTATAFGDTRVKYAPARVLGRRFGVLRRAPQWNGGFSYTLGGNSTRSLSEEVFDGSSADLVDIIFMPSRIDMFGEGGKSFIKMRFNLGFVQARGLGPKDNKDQTIYTDHLEALLGASVPFGGGASMDLVLGHRTLSYSSNAFVSLDTIPVSTLHLRFLNGPADDGLYVGVFGHYGEDGQSVPEFNSKYQLFGGGIASGICIRI